VFYPWKTLAPIDLKPMYELPMRVSLLEPPFLTAALPVVGITIALVPCGGAGRPASPSGSPTRSRWRR